MEPGDDLLETAVQRRGVLAALAAAPHHRRELQTRLDISKTTCHRIVRSFDEKGLLRRTADGYELTALGRTLHEQVDAYERGVRAARRLEPLLSAFEAAEVAFDVSLFADATVTRPQPEDPSPPVTRFLELFRDAETVKSLDGTSFTPPLYVEEMFETAMQDGGRGIAIFPKSVVERRLSAHPDLHRRAAEAEVPVRYRVHDDIPFGLTIYDGDRVGLRAYDDETGALLLFADTDDPEAVDWAERLFERYYDQSEPLSAFDAFPDWMPASELRL